MLYFFVALVVVSLGYFIAWPLIGSTASLAESPVPGRHASGETPERLTRALAEIDLDHSTGKINDEDWRTARAPLEAEVQALGAAGSGRQTVTSLDLELEVHISRARHRQKQADKAHPA